MPPDPTKETALRRKLFLLLLPVWITLIALTLYSAYTSGEFTKTHVMLLGVSGSGAFVAAAHLDRHVRRPWVWTAGALLCLAMAGVWLIRLSH